MLVFAMSSHLVWSQCQSLCLQLSVICILSLNSDPLGHHATLPWKNSLGHSLPRSVRSRILRRQSKIPQESEGILAPDSQPITSKACLELLADKVLAPLCIPSHVFLPYMCQQCESGTNANVCY